MTKRLGKQTLAISLTVTLLVLAVAALAYLNAGDLDRKKELEKTAQFVLIQGENRYKVSAADIAALAPVDFETVMRSAKTGTTPVSFTGVELRLIFSKYDVEIKADSTIQVTSLDGYASALTGEEVLAEKNAYLAVAMNGETLKPMSDGGSGPYYLVLPNTEFAQRWVKSVEEIVVK